MTFTWAPAKAETNLKKHGIDFREAATVFDDSGSVAFPDTDHSWGEQRYVSSACRRAAGYLLWRTWK